MNMLLMPWLLASQDISTHDTDYIEQVGEFLSYLRKDFNYLCHVNMEAWHKM